MGTRRLNVVLDARSITRHPTGIARSTMTLLTGIARTGPDVTIRVLAGDAEALPKTVRTSSACDIVQATGSPRPLSLDLGPCAHLLRTLKPDVVCSPDTCAPVRRTRWASVSVIHDLIPIMHARELRATSKGKHWRLWRAWLRAQTRSCTRIVTPSAWTKPERTRLLGTDADRIDVVPNAVELPRATPQARASDAESFRASIGLAAHEQIVLFVGRRAPYKHTALLMGAFATLAESNPHARLLFVGPDDPRFLDAEHEADRLSLRDRVVFAGPVDDETLRAAYAAASMVACPSRAEGFGLSVLEALAHRVPIVASDIPPHLEVLGDLATSKNQLVRTVAPNDDQAWTQALRDMLTNQNTLHANSDALAVRAAHFSPEQQALAAIRSWTRAADPNL